ncbi:nucleoside hydrolase [Mycoplasmatota bacterium zrk1]
MDKRKIIFDTDPGIDDAYGIIAAMKQPDMDVLGICTVAGNKGIEFTTTNALKLVHLMDYDCMVYKGAGESMLKVSEDAGATHGADGLGGVKLDYDESKLSDMHAVDYILETVKANPGEIEIIALGPVTNIALAINKDPETMKKVKVIWTMGGGVHRGNITPVAEFNYWYDAKAVEIMFSIGTDVPIHMIGLDVTHSSVFTGNDLTFMKLEGGKLGEILFEMVGPYIESYWKHSRYTGCVIHDLLTVIYAIDQSVCPEEGIYHSNLRVSTKGITIGQTVVDLVNSWKLPINSIVPMKVDSRKYKEIFFEVLFGKEKVELYKKHVKS